MAFVFAYWPLSQPPKKSVIRAGCLGSVPGRLLRRLAADGPLFLPRSLSLADTFILEINIGRDDNCVLCVFFWGKISMTPYSLLPHYPQTLFWMFLEAVRSKHLECCLIYQPSECWPVIPKLFQLFLFRFFWVLIYWPDNRRAKLFLYKLDDKEEIFLLFHCQISDC